MNELFLQRRILRRLRLSVLLRSPDAPETPDRLATLIHNAQYPQWHGGPHIAPQEPQPLYSPFDHGSERNSGLQSEDGFLRPTPPFDFAKSLDFLGAFPAMTGDQAVTEQSLTKATTVKGRTVVFQLRSTGTIKQPRLRCTLFSGEGLSRELKESVLDRISFFLSLNDDLLDFYRMGREDPRFAPIIEKLYGFHHVKFLTAFECACWAILSQHNLMSLARKMKHALAEKYGSSLRVDEHAYWTFPEPVSMARAGRSDLLSLVRNRRRSEYLSEVSRAFSGVDENWLRTADYDALETWLRKIKGVGEWSAELILLRGLGQLEKLRIEKRLLTTVSNVYNQGRPVTAERLNELAEKYGPWKGY